MTVAEMVACAREHSLAPLFNAGVYSVEYDRFGGIHVMGRVKPDGGKWETPTSEHKFFTCIIGKVRIVINGPDAATEIAETGEAAAEGIEAMERG